MDLVEELIFNIMLVMFPILVYFVYKCYNQVFIKKYNFLLLGFTLFSSVYLSLKYGGVSTNNVILLFCNIPIIIAYIKKDGILGLLLSLVVILYCYFNFDYNIYVLLIKYSVYAIIYYYLKTKVDKSNFIKIIFVVQGFFLSFEYFFVNNAEDLVVIIKLLFLVIIVYTITIIILYLLNLGDKITTLYSEIKILEKEKKIKESLFKITHEIKNPIAVCKGYLDMLDVNDKNKINRYIPIIREEIDRSLNIMTDFMQFSKIKLDKEIVDINLLLDDVYDNFKILNKLKNIELKYIESNEEIYINGDYNRLKQVLINLIKNSAEAIKSKGKIIIKSENNSKEFKILIIDNGCGMSKETLSKIKEIFYTTKEKGSGIGVSLSNEIIKAHGGSLEYDSKLGEGTIVKITLPILKNVC